MPVTRAYRGVPAEQRRRQRRQQLVETALDCLHDDGLAGVSVRSICARARLTPRYFYESFDDLDQLLLAVVDGVADEVAASALRALDAAPEDLATRVRAAIDAGYGVVVSDRRKATALLVAASGNGALREHRQQVITRFADLVIDRLPVLRAFGVVERRRARAAALFLMGGASEVVEAVLAGRLRLSRAAVVAQLTTSWLAVLTAPSPPEPGNPARGR